MSGALCAVSTDRLVGSLLGQALGDALGFVIDGAAARSRPSVLSDREAMCRVAREQARMTHLDPRCAAGAVAVADAVAIAAAGIPIEAAAFLEDVAECAETEGRSVAEAIRGLCSWVSLTPFRGCPAHAAVRARSR